MHIAQLAPLVESVPPVGYGGTELVVSLLTEELLRKGHKVTLIASGDSKTNARLISVIPENLRKSCNDLRHRWAAYDLRALITLEEMQSEFDLVHNHMGYQALPFLANLNCPSLTTIHNPVKDYCKDVYFRYADLSYASISDAFKRLNYAEKLNYSATVYNGIETGNYRSSEKSKRKYLLFIGRVCEAKGTAKAVDIASRLGLPLKIAGKVDIPDQEYFETLVKPRLSSSIEFLGEVNEAQKAGLYADAIATVYPIDFDEPFGLVMAESLASGTPVMGFDRGSVRELILDSKTGIVANNENELVNRFKEIDSISPEACVARAVNMFSKEIMANNYEAQFEKLIAGFKKTGKKEYEKCL